MALVIAGFPGLAVIAWEIWPSLRNVFDDRGHARLGGRRSGLIDSFLEA